MIEELKYIILGLIQGLAEFFPISSSGHVLLFANILDVAENHPLLLSITVHFATTLSTIIIYKKRISNLLIGICQYQRKADMQFSIKLLISMIPIVTIGFFFRDKIDLLFKDAQQLTCVMLVFTGCILILSQMFKKSTNQISYYHALILGLAQGLAIIPGISRSGITIVIALGCKIKRLEAAEFSFLMVLLPIIGITIIEIYTVYSLGISIDVAEIKSLVIAFSASFISGLFACKYMIRIVQRNNLKYFGYYCCFIGVLLIIIL